MMDGQGDDEGLEIEIAGGGVGFSSHGAYQLVEDAVSHTAYSVYTSHFETSPLKNKVPTSYFTPITIQTLHFSHPHAASRNYDTL